MNTFRAVFEGIPIMGTLGVHELSTVNFTENQLLVPPHLKNKFVNKNIKNAANYELVYKNDIDIRERYKVKIGNEILRLSVNKYNEDKLRSIHGLEPLRKVHLPEETPKQNSIKINISALPVGIIKTIWTIFIGVLIGYLIFLFGWN